MRACCRQGKHALHKIRVPWAGGHAAKSTPEIIRYYVITPERSLSSGIAQVDISSSSQQTFNNILATQSGGDDERRCSVPILCVEISS